ncbi:MAG: hypothetical protein EA419_06975 [Wenzhouxiangella sp.]|nr:MAG: hypothetical protein EA419_06975 [Wenzhouxiangella sp.]
MNEITAAAIDSAVRIHKDFGPGLMDSVYEAILHRKLRLTYLKLSGLQVGLLLNFGAHLMRDGIARLVCDFNEK